MRGKVTETRGLRVAVGACTRYNKEVDRVTHQRDREREKDGGLEEWRWRSRARHRSCHATAALLMSH